MRRTSQSSSVSVFRRIKRYKERNLRFVIVLYSLSAQTRSVQCRSDPFCDDIIVCVSPFTLLTGVADTHRSGCRSRRQGSRLLSEREAGGGSHLSSAQRPNKPVLYRDAVKMDGATSSQLHGAAAKALPCALSLTAGPSPLLCLPTATIRAA